jgi:putative transposase
MASTRELVPLVGVTAACQALGVGRASFYRGGRSQPAAAERWGAAAPVAAPTGDGGLIGRSAVLTNADAATAAPMAAASALALAAVHPRALRAAEQQAVLDLLHSPRFRDAAPAAVYATLLDEGVYLASERTMYRLLAAAGESRDRRDQLVHPTYSKPELLATEPNQVWSWDITKLLGPVKWSYYYLYVLLDIYSRYVTGWMVAHAEQAALAERLMAESIAKQGVPAGQLTLHADRGSSMTSKPVAFLLADLGVIKPAFERSERTHSRPHVSNDNPFSEAQFKTLKYRPGFPDRFASIAAARAFCQDFFHWYNTEHRHSGIGLLPPEAVHYGRAVAMHAARGQVLATAYAAHPERFVRHAPQPPQLPTAAYINPPTPASNSQEVTH